MENGEIISLEKIKLLIYKHSYHNLSFPPLEETKVLE